VLTSPFDIDRIGLISWLFSNALPDHTCRPSAAETVPGQLWPVGCSTWTGVGLVSVSLSAFLFLPWSVATTTDHGRRRLLRQFLAIDCLDPFPRHADDDVAESGAQVSRG